jgi:hypothetical protein
MNVYVSRSACSGRYRDGIKTQSPLEFRHVGGKNFRVDVVKAELASLLSLNYVRRCKFLKMMRDSRLRDFEEGLDIRAV